MGTFYRYQVIDIQTGDVMGTYSSSVRAHRRADVLDTMYGAHRYTVKVA